MSPAQSGLRRNAEEYQPVASLADAGPDKAMLMPARAIILSSSSFTARRQVPTGKNSHPDVPAHPISITVISAECGEAMSAPFTLRDLDWPISAEPNRQHRKTRHTPQMPGFQTKRADRGPPFSSLPRTFVRISRRDR